MDTPAAGRHRHFLALISVSAYLVAQRPDGNSKDIGRVCPVSPVASQCLENDLALDGRERVPDQMFDEMLAMRAY